MRKGKELAFLQLATVFLNKFHQGCYDLHRDLNHDLIQTLFSI